MSKKATAATTAKKKAVKAAWTEDEMLELARTYRDGAKVSDICKSLGKSARAVHQKIFKLRQAGVKIERRRTRGVDVAGLNEKLGNTATAKKKAAK